MSNFTASFAFSCAMLVASAGAAELFGGGIGKMGGNGLQGYVSPRAEFAGGRSLTMGSGALIQGGSQTAATQTFATVATHELGHTLQFAAISMAGGVAGEGDRAVAHMFTWGTYLAFGLPGAAGGDSFAPNPWEENASAIGY